MFVSLVKESVFQAIILANPILIELSVLTAEFVGRPLTIVSSDVVNDARKHMSVLLARTNRRPKRWSHVFHHVPADA